MFITKPEDLNSSDIEKKKKAIQAIGDSGDKKFIPLLMEMLAKESDIIVMNSLALSLGKLKANQAIPLLMELIRNPLYRDKRGTFIYTLLSLECKDYFHDFVEMICTGNFEVYDHSCRVLEAIADDIDIKSKLEAIDILKAQQQIELSKHGSMYPQFERINYINSALEILAI